MASSSIEVMGMTGEEMKVMLLQDEGPQDEEMAQRMQDIIHNTGTLGHIIETGPPVSQLPPPDGQDEDFQTLSQFSSVSGMVPPPGAIIFSPQDLNRASKPPTRGRGRGRGGFTVKTENPAQEQAEVPVACKICNKVMMTGKTLVQHMAIHSDMKPFQCPHCPKSFSRKVHLQGHLAIHGIEKQFECPVCHQRFSRQDCVKVHMRLHDKSKCVYCDVCHKAFLTLGALNIHLRIHRGEKPFKCHLCSKCFTQKNHLITHIKRHTKVEDEHFTKKLGPRMFKCEHCTRAFIRLSDYERHVQWNHGAVAEGSIVDKLPTVGNLLDGEMKQTGLAPQVFKAPKDAINSKSYRPRRGRKVMCTTSTQTDEGGGHVIIPRIYQSQVSTSTQVSAPPTPRPADDDMYESDIFDEGMDRNYSSDEDEDDPQFMGKADESKIYTVAATSDTASDPVQDAAFDAIVQGSSTKPLSKEEEDPAEPEAEGTEEANEQNDDFMQEVVSSLNKQVLDVREPVSVQGGNDNITKEERFEDANANLREEAESPPPPPSNPVPAPSPPPPESTTETVSVIEANDVIAAEHEDSPEQTSMNNDLLFADAGGFHFSAPVMMKGTRGRVKTRGRGGKRQTIEKYNCGLSGATELRYIRRSMMMRVMKASASMEKEGAKEVSQVQCKEESDASKAEEVKASPGVPEDVETEGRSKRMAKKQHGEDFVCNMKSCETCIPSQKTNVKTQPKVNVKLKEKELENADSVPKKKDVSDSPQLLSKGGLPIKKSTVPVNSSDMPMVKSAVPVSSTDKPWVTQTSQIDVQKLRECVKSANEKSKVSAGIEENIHNSGKREREEAPEELKMKVANHVGTYPVDITANPLMSVHVKKMRQDYFVSSKKSESIISPPVELMSFCIPTYSCKLCGREFRFEGKLHRHIESVHQNKAIFSADVKPGRGSSRYSAPKTERFEEIPAMPSPEEMEPENPEIAALRSEWSDEDDDGGGGDEEMRPVHSSQIPARTAVTTISSTPYNIHPPITIVTREITPMTTTISGSVYTSGVKVNMNKLSGLLPQVKDGPITSTSQIKESSNLRVSTSVTSVAPSAPRVTETILPETLDMKCRRLLEKLFDHDLLMNCGLMEEHVSVVLGRVLQHYGVKMIEDYGQGQYEVLKYNLWRLIEWKVTMEQMEEFYTAGKSVEEMMEDIMNERVPLVSHHFVPNEQKANPPPVSQPETQVTQVETVEVTDGQMVLQQVAGVLGGQLNLPEGVTQVVLAQDVSPELLQGAHIVTIDPTTGQVISQVTAEQVILTDAIGDELEQQVAALDGQVVVSQAHMTNQAPSQEGIVVSQTPTIAMHTTEGQVSHGQVIVHAAPTATVSQPQTIKIDTTTHSSGEQHHLNQQ